MLQGGVGQVRAYLADVRICCAILTVHNPGRVSALLPSQRPAQGAGCRHL